MDTLIFFAVFVAGAAYVVQPFFKRSRPELADPTVGTGRHDDPLLLQKAEIVEAIRDLDFEYATGKLSEEDYATLRASYRVRALELLDQLGNVPGAPLAAKAPEPSHIAHVDPAEPTGTPSGPLSMFCTRCGMRVAAGDRFCGACGTPLHLIPTTTTSSAHGGSR